MPACGCFSEALGKEHKALAVKFSKTGPEEPSAPNGLD